MKTNEAITRTWESLFDVEHYFKNGIPQQLATATTFSGEDAVPIHKAQLTLKQCEPFLPSDIKKNAEEVLLTAFDQFNLFVEALRRVTESSNGDQRQIATKEANSQLQSCLDTYRDKLAMFSKVIPKDISNSVTQNITVSGTVSGQLNIAGNSIDAPNMNITLAELTRKIEESNDSSKHEAKSKLASLLKHPLVIKILGGAAGGIMG